MRAVRSKDTGPELTVRKLLHSAGFRYRLHSDKLAGRPDIVFPARRKVIFVHGCFWHGHDCARGVRVPKTNVDYWVAKVRRNKQRDVATMATLAEQEWKSLVIWECEMKDQPKMLERLIAFLGPSTSIAQH
jgi:DNA mismatch endonuclease (patch repair protein)